MATVLCYVLSFFSLCPSKTASRGRFAKAAVTTRDFTQTKRRRDITSLIFQLLNLENNVNNWS